MIGTDPSPERECFHALQRRAKRREFYTLAVVLAGIAGIIALSIVGFRQ